MFGFMIQKGRSSLVRGAPLSSINAFPSSSPLPFLPFSQLGLSRTGVDSRLLATKAASTFDKVWTELPRYQSGPICASASSYTASSLTSSAKASWTFTFPSMARRYFSDDATVTAPSKKEKKKKEIKLTQAEIDAKEQETREAEALKSATAKLQEQGAKPQYEQRIKESSTIYTAKGELGRHTIDDIGKYYHLDDAAIQRIPECFRKCTAFELEMAGNYVMVREPGVGIVQEMKKVAQKVVGSIRSTNSPSNMNVFSVVGHRGTGKSVALSYACQYAKQNGWLTVAMRAEEWTKDHLGVIKESKIHPGVFDQALFTSNWLGNLRKAEEEQLKKILLKLESYKYDWSLGKAGTTSSIPSEQSGGDGKTSKKSTGMKSTETSGDVAAAGAISGDRSNKGKTLYDLVRLGANVPDFAPTILYEFIKELELATEIPVLVCIDNINEWEHITKFRHPKTINRLYPRNLAGVHAFSQFATRAPSNGVTLFAVTHNATMKNVSDYVRHSDKMFSAVTYSERELRQCLNHYYISKYLLTPVEKDLVDRFYGLSGGVPRDVLNMSRVL